MVKIEKAILHVLDTGANMVVDSQLVLDDESARYLGRLLTQLLRDPAAKHTSLKENGPLTGRLETEETDYAAFLDHSREIGQLLFEGLRETDDCEVYDFVFCEFSNAERPYTALLLLPNLKAYAHRVLTEEDGIRSVQFRMFKAFLPTTAQKVSDYLIVSRVDGSVRLKNGKRSRNDEAFELLTTLFTEKPQKSQKESVKAIDSIITEVTEFHGSNTTEALNRAKLYMLEHAEEEQIAPKELAAEVFEDSPVMREAFQEKAREEKLPETVRVEKAYAERVSKVQKIKTNTGIELSIPAMLLRDPDVIEFVNNEDGTISIEIKNVEKLSNR